MYFFWRENWGTDHTRVRPVGRSLGPSFNWIATGTQQTRQQQHFPSQASDEVGYIQHEWASDSAQTQMLTPTIALDSHWKERRRHHRSVIDRSSQRGSKQRN